MALTLSIITPTYNQEKYIEETIKSILSQEGNFYIDYIIINDGSTDNTISIIEKYDKLLKEKKWPIKCNGISYRYKTRKNGGQTSAINEGLKMAKGYAATWMNSDDYYLPGAFEAVAKEFEKNPDIDFIYTDFMRVYENKNKSTIYPRPNPNETLETLKTRGNSFAVNFFTMRIVKEIGYLDESLQYCMDLDMWFRIFQKAKTKYLPETIAAFRIWSNSKTTTGKSKFEKERELIRKRYGANIMPPHKIHKFRKKLSPMLNIIQNKTPRLYEVFKNIFYKIIDLFKY